MRRVLNILILTASVTTLAAANPGAGERGESMASVELAGTILSVTPSIPLASATLRVAGPESYEAITWSQGEAMVLDLEADGFFSDSENNPASRSSLPDGHYGYEVVLHLRDGEIRLEDGRFVVENGVIRLTASDPHLPPVDPAGTERADSEDGLTSVSAAASEDDILQVHDTNGDGVTVLGLDSVNGTPDVGDILGIQNKDGELQFTNYDAFNTRQTLMTLEPTSATRARLGIGTTQPNADLHIFSPAGVIRITDSDACSGVSGDPDDPSAWEIEEDSGRLAFELVPNCPGDPAGGKMWIASSGNVGIGTPDPSAQLTIHHEGHGGDMRLTGAGQSYTLGIRGSNGELVVQGAGTTGQEILRIKSDAPHDSIVVAPAGVGIGTSAPAADLTVHDGGDGGDLLLTGPTSSYLLGIRAGSGDFVIQGAGGVGQDAFRITPDAFDEAMTIGAAGVGIGTVVPAAKLHVVGSAILEGDMALGSSRTIKHEIEPLDAGEILDAVRELPLYSWKYLEDASQAAHVGPMAEDVYATFRLGRDERHLSPSDSAGLALAAVKGIDQRFDRELEDLRARLEILALANEILADQNSSLRERLTEIERGLAQAPDPDFESFDSRD